MSLLYTTSPETRPERERPAEVDARIQVITFATEFAKQTVARMGINPEEITQAPAPATRHATATESKPAPVDSDSTGPDLTLTSEDTLAAHREYIQSIASATDDMRNFVDDTSQTA